MKEISTLEEILGYEFHNKDLLLQALTHSSYANEHYETKLMDNERLEFLGDAVLDMIVSQILFDSEKNKAEGDLTKLRAAIVCEKSLAEISKANTFNEYILLGKGEEQNGGRLRDSIIADGVEAIIGAIYLDSGYNATIPVVRKIFSQAIENAEVGKTIRDSKTELQEILQANGPCNIEYKLIKEEGPDHDKLFSFSVSANGKIIGEGQGKSKKEAQANAAEAALRGL